MRGKWHTMVYKWEKVVNRKSRKKVVRKRNEKR